jgi:fucose permease
MASYKNNIWKMYLFGFLTDIFFISGVLVPFYTMWGKISFTQIMLLQSFFVFSMFALEVPTGVVADKFGRKASLALGALVIVAGTIIYSSYPSFYVFMLGEFLWALGRALISGAEEAIVYDSLKHLKEESSSKKIFARMESISKFGLMDKRTYWKLYWSGSWTSIHYDVHVYSILLCLCHSHYAERA